MNKFTKFAFCIDTKRQMGDDDTKDMVEGHFEWLTGMTHLLIPIFKYPNYF